MRTRSQSKRSHPGAAPAGEQEAAEGHNGSETVDDNETLSNISRDAVGKLLKRVKKGFNKEDVTYLRHDDSDKKLRGAKVIDENCAATTVENDTAVLETCGAEAEARVCASSPEKGGNANEYDDSEWEDGFIPTLSSTKDFQEDLMNGVSVEFDISHESEKRKHVRRATAEEREAAELVHMVHLLCLLGRGRLIDSACNDPLIQASLLSLVPTHLLKMAETQKLTARHLSPLVSWFHNNFHVRSPYVAEKSCHLALASALETREGTPEAIGALSVALFRALNLTARFVSILDVVSLKPDGDKMESSMEEVGRKGKGIFNSSTLMVAGSSCSPASSVKPSPKVEHDSNQAAVRDPSRHKTDKLTKNGFKSKDAPADDKTKNKTPDVPVSEAPIDLSESGLVKSEGVKRKGDLEFQMQLEMALAATAIECKDNTCNVSESPSTSATPTPPSKKMKTIKKEEFQTNSNGISTAIGSKKVGAPLYWAEVFCSGENLTGRWVHVDAVNAIIDGELKVEAAAAACKKFLRYVVAFAGHGAKDVTRRYCTKWYKVGARRVNSIWWDAVLGPLRELESAATGSVPTLESEPSGQVKSEASQLLPLNHGCLDKNNPYETSEECHKAKTAKSSLSNTFASTRSSLEDMELETRALTEPLPTNQQAYRTHHLYVIERWVKKYEVLYPKGPVLGFCSGHPVYPRTCVQRLHTKERWLREGLQVKAGEIPAKILKQNLKQSNKEDAKDENEHIDEQGSTALFGKWQTEPLCLPKAVNGIVPRNEWGRVDVWSEKCLPPGTVHLPSPRIAQVAKRLDIDFAPAMVGFEFRNGRSFPSFEGIVVCAEFRDAILEAYLEEEERRVAEEKRRNEAQALARWYQLLSSIITRQRLNNSYGDGAFSESSTKAPKPDQICSTSTTATQKNEESPRSRRTNTPAKHSTPTENHEHEFILVEPASEEEGSTLTKRCHCGFSIQFEEL